MKLVYDLSQLEWQVAGFVPHQWRFTRSERIAANPGADVPAIPAPVPGSVQQALLNAGAIPDWNVGLNARACEWVENRHWIYETVIPDGWLASGRTFRLRCLGLDYQGCVLLNGKEVGAFQGTFVPHLFDLTPFLLPAGNVLQIVFELSPRWLGQFGFTSRMTEWKPRYNYTWDWTSRLVQIGIWDGIFLEATEGAEIETLRCTTDANPAGKGSLRAWGAVTGGEGLSVQLSLEAGGAVIRQSALPAAHFNAEGISWQDLPVSLWWPNGEGGRPLYTLHCRLLDSQGYKVDEESRTVGFKRVEWRACEGAPAGADPWICAVNGRPIFLQGVNWTPIRPNFADVSEDDYRQRLETYRDLGCNLLRVWGGAFLEKECFYRLCDELGLLVWQEFPLSSSGCDNWPPEDEASISALSEIARSYIARRQHHASLLLWCGGNELQGSLDGSKSGGGKPVGMEHPLLQRFQQIVATQDPGRRFLPTSSSGPLFFAEEANYGKGLHWDVHGPWRPEGDLAAWARYWAGDDALFRSETGAPGASSVEIIRRYKGEYPEVPGTHENPIWQRTSWWIEWPEFVAEKGREPANLEEYVAWSQERQARALAIAARACKARFPRCGGLLIWMGHDSFPCTANTSIVDFHGRPKPAARAVAEVFRGK